jgi:hypothetical protein
VILSIGAGPVSSTNINNFAPIGTTYPMFFIRQRRPTPDLWTRCDVNKSDPIISFNHVEQNIGWYERWLSKAVHGSML